VSPVPTECQAQDDAVATLTKQYNDLVDQANSLSGDAVWPVLAQLGALSLQLAAAKAELAHCIDIHTKPQTTGDFAEIAVTVHTIGAATGSPAGPQQATVWAVTDSGAESVLVAQVENGAFGVNQVFPPRTAISVATTGNADLSGPDFRSGVLEDLTGDPLRLEIVVGPVIRVSQEELNTLLATQTPMPTPAINSSMVQANGTLTSLTVGFEPGVATVTGRGSVTGSVFGVSLGDLAFTGSIDLAVAPSFALDAGALIELKAVNPVSVEFSGSPIASTANALAEFLGPFIENLGISQLRARLSQWLPAAVSESLLLAGLPKDCTLSVRGLSIESGAISAQPVIGCVGNTLSTYDPPAIPYA
jgi:hypothetical protein